MKLFTAFGEACKSYGGPGNPSVSGFSSLDPERGCDLAHANDLVRKLTDHIKGMGSVRDMKGVVTRLERVDGLWRLSVDASCASADAEGGYSGATSGASSSSLLAERVFLATGSHPRTFAPAEAPHVLSAARTGAPAAQELHLDLGLSPRALAAGIRPEDEVAVVGASHSAVLVLKNLHELPAAARPRRIVNFYRSGLRYAEYKDDEHGQWILRDNTGLKGVAADWARVHLEEGMQGAVPGLQRVRLSGQPGQDQEVYDRALKGCTKIIYAVGGWPRSPLCGPSTRSAAKLPCSALAPAAGYDRNRLPELVAEGGRVVDSEAVRHDRSTGQLLEGSGAPLPGLFGFGIAFPELWTDPYGNQEDSVGMWKFMRYLKKAVPEALGK